MMRIVQLLTLLSLATPSFAARPYEGPQECSDEDRVKRGDYIEIHYIGSIHEDSDTEGKGKVFDNSNDHGNTYNFQVGHGEVIKGLDERLIGICKGAKVIIEVAPEYGFGEFGSGEHIPPGAKLHFDVEIMSVKGSPPEPDLFRSKDLNGDGFLDKEELDAFYKKVGRKFNPRIFWHEDEDKDGRISWHEFSGPKGANPAGEEEL